MTDELLDLLKEIDTLNRKGCQACGGSGHYKKLDTSLNPPDEYTVDCPTCHGTGAKVPALNETESIYVDNPTNEVGVLLGKIPRNHELKYGYVNPAYILPAPTVEELMKMLKEKINPVLFSVKDGGWGVYSSREITPGSDWIHEDSPLIALLKLTLWWIKQP